MTSVAHAAPLRPGTDLLAGRFAARPVRLRLWLAWWAVVAAVETAALLPLLDGAYPKLPAVYVVMRLVGGSFAVCGRSPGGGARTTAAAR